MNTTIFILLMLAAFAISGVIAGVLSRSFFREKKIKKDKIPPVQATEKYKELAKKEFELLNAAGIIKKDNLWSNVEVILRDKFQINENIEGVNKVIKKIDDIIGDQITNENIEKELISSTNLARQPEKVDCLKEINEIESYIHSEKIGTDIDKVFINRLIETSKKKNKEGNDQFALAYMSAAKSLFDYERDKALKSREEVNPDEANNLLKSVEDLINMQKSQRFVDTFFPEFVLKEARESAKKGDFKLAKELAELSRKMLTDKDSAYKLRRLSEIIDSDVGLP